MNLGVPPSSQLDIAAYARDSAALAVDYVARALGPLASRGPVSARTRAAWIETFTVEVARSCDVRWSWQTVPGAGVGADDVHVDSLESWERAAAHIGQQLRTGPVATHALHTHVSGSKFGRSLANARLYEPPQRLVCHLACTNCHGQSRMRCAGCRGTGSIECGSCRGRADPVRLDSGQLQATCGACAASGRVSCPECFGVGAAACRPCNGTGRMSRVTRFFVSATEEHVLHDTSITDPRVRVLVRDVFNSERDDVCRQEMCSFDAGACGTHTQRFVFSVPVSEVDVAINGRAASLLVAGYRPGAWFANTVFDPIVQEGLGRFQVAETARPWLRPLQAGRAGRWLARATAAPLVAQLLELSTGPASVGLGVRVDASASKIEGLGVIIRRLNFALSPGVAQAATLLLHQHAHIARTGTRAKAFGLGVLSAACAAMAHRFHIGLLPAAAGPSVVAVLAFCYAALV